MSEIKTLAIDLAKNVLQLHGVDERGVCVLRRQVRRAHLLRVVSQFSPCTVVMEACSGAHHWGRQMIAMGNQVRLIAPQFVKPFVKGNKTDRNDAEAICEAAQRPSMRYVPVKNVEQQQVLMLHRLREGTKKARTALSNRLRGVLTEFGVVLAQGVPKLLGALPVLMEDQRLPALLRAELQQQYRQLRELDAELKRLTKCIEEQVRTDERAQLLLSRAGVGVISASAFAAEISDPHVFRNGRQVSAWLGLVPAQHSSGGAPTLLGISKRGDAYLRTLLIHGARSVLRTAHRSEEPLHRWAKAVSERRGFNKAVVALANKMARQMWAQLAYASRTGAEI